MEATLNLSALTVPVFVISLIIAILAIIGTQAAIPFVSGHAFWIAILAYVVLMLANLLKGL